MQQKLRQFLMIFKRNITALLFKQFQIQYILVFTDMLHFIFKDNGWMKLKTQKDACHVCHKKNQSQSCFISWLPPFLSWAEPTGIAITGAHVANRCLEDVVCENISITSIIEGVAICLVQVTSSCCKGG